MAKDRTGKGKTVAWPKTKKTGQDGKKSGGGAKGKSCSPGSAKKAASGKLFS